MECKNCKELFFENSMENILFCKDCYADRLIQSYSVCGIPFFLLANGSDLTVVAYDPLDRLGRAKVKIAEHIKSFYQSRPVQDNVGCVCGSKVKLEQSILVQADGIPVAFCDMDCYEKWKGIYLCQKSS